VIILHGNVNSNPEAEADCGVVMIVVPSDSWKRDWMKRPLGMEGVANGGTAGMVRKQNVSGWRTGMRVERSVEREVSPGAGAGAGIWEAMM
jgi:hypothetical protein